MKWVRVCDRMAAFWLRRRRAAARRILRRTGVWPRLTYPLVQEDK